MADQEPTTKIISRRYAQASGLLRYFTGIPCLRGHLSERATQSKKCLECHRLRRAWVRQTQASAVKAQKAASYLRHADTVKAKARAYQHADPVRMHRRQKAYREANKEKISERMKEWSKANRPLLRAHERNRRERKRGAEGKHTYSEVQTLAERQRFRCANPACGKSIRSGWHEDHIMPLALGGSNWIKNIQLLCQPCNQSKHARHPIDWAQTNGLLL